MLRLAASYAPCLRLGLSPCLRCLLCASMRLSIRLGSASGLACGACLVGFFRLGNFNIMWLASCVNRKIKKIRIFFAWAISGFIGCALRFSVAAFLPGLRFSLAGVAVNAWLLLACLACFNAGLVALLLAFYARVFSFFLRLSCGLRFIGLVFSLALRLAICACLACFASCGLRNFARPDGGGGFWTRTRPKAHRG